MFFLNGYDFRSKEEAELSAARLNFKMAGLIKQGFQADLTSTDVGIKGVPMKLFLNTFLYGNLVFIGACPGGYSRCRRGIAFQ